MIYKVCRDDIFSCFMQKRGVPLPEMILPAVAIAFEVEVQMKYSTFKCAFESFLMRVLPLFVDDSESLLKRKLNQQLRIFNKERESTENYCYRKITYNVLIRRTSMEPYDASFCTITVLLNVISWSF